MTRFEGLVKTAQVARDRLGDGIPQDKALWFRRFVRESVSFVEECWRAAAPARAGGDEQW